MRRIAGPGAVGTAALVLALLAGALHLPVFTEGALITPAGMHHAMWPWKATLPATAASGARLQENHTLSDLLFQFYPWQLHITRTLGSGATPLWNPYSYTGVPFVANAQSAVFYPLHWPAWLIPSMKVFTLAQLLKILLAGIFMAVFLRGLGMSRAPAALGAVSFALCGFMTSWLGYAITNAAIWLPLLMHAARELALRPRVWPFLLLAAATGAQFLGGHPQTSLHIMAAATAWHAWCLWSRARGTDGGGAALPPRPPRTAASVSFFLGGAALGTATAAVQLLPFIAYLLPSAALAQRQALAGGMEPNLPPGAILTMLVPDWYGLPWNFSWTQPVPFQEAVGYAGAGVLLLALVSLRWWRQMLFFHLAAGVSALVVFGPHPVRAALSWIPVVGINSNNRLLLLLAFCLAVLAAWTLQRCIETADHAASAESGGGGAGERPGTRRRLLMWLAGCAAALVIAAATAGAAGGGAGGGGSAAAHFEAGPSASTGSTTALVAATALLAALVLMRPSRKGMYLAGVVALTALDLFLFAYRFNPHADPRHLFPQTRLIDFLRRDAGADMARGGRLLTVGWTMRPETQMVFRLSSIEGYDAMEYRPYRRLLDRADVVTIQRTGHIPATSRPLLDLIGTRYVVTPPGGVVSGDGMTLAYDAPDGRIFLNELAIPRLSWVPGSRPAGDAGAALEALASGAVDPRREVLIASGEGDGGAAGPPAPGADAGPSAEAAGKPAAGPAGAAPETGMAPGAGAVPGLGTKDEDGPRLVLEKATEGELSVTVQGAPAGGWLVVMDAWDAGWQATVNGAPETVRRAQTCFRAVPVPAGDSIVRMVYRPLSFRAGAWISSLAFLTMLAVALVLLGTPSRGATRRPDAVSPSDAAAPPSAATPQSASTPPSAAAPPGGATPPDSLTPPGSLTPPDAPGTSNKPGPPSASLFSAPPSVEQP